MAATQIAALSVTMQHYETHERATMARRLEATTLDLERARMQAEDLRSAAFSAQPADDGGPVTWRQLAQSFVANSRRVVDLQIYSALELLGVVNRILDVHGEDTPPPSTAEWRAMTTDIRELVDEVSTLLNDDDDLV